MSNFVGEVPVPLNTLSLWSRGALHEHLQQDGLTVEDAQTIWQSLLGSLSTPTLSEKQTISTCNCVRIFLKSISTAKNPDIRKFPLARNAWIGCYHAVFDAWHRAKVKPLAQVLEILLQTAKKGMSEDELNSAWRIISLQLSAVLLRGQPARHLKGALALSAFFLEKSLSYEIYRDSAEQNIGQGNGVEKNTSDILECLISGVLLAFEQHDAQSSAEKCFKALLKAQDATDLHSWWFLVRNFTADHIDSLDTIAASIFPVLLEQEPALHLDVIQWKCECEDKAGLLFSLALLQSLRDREMISQRNLTGMLQRIVIGPDSDAPDAIDLLLSHADDGVRVRVLRLLVSSKMTNAPLSLPILRHLQHCIYLWFRPGGSHERGEILSIIRRLLIRLRGGSSALEKTANSSTLDMELLNAHKKFVATLVPIVLSELRPNASYQRQIMGLSIFRYLLESKIDSCDRSLVHQDGEKRSNDPEWPFSLCLRQTNTPQDLLNLASDAYEDVRALSASILIHLLASGPNAHSQSFSKQLQAAIELLIPELEQQAVQTNRSDQADGLGRIYSLHALTQRCTSGSGKSANDPPFALGLLDRLKRLLSDKPILDKPLSQPLHSLLLGVMYCMENEKIEFEARKRVISICYQVWRAVADRLCVDSPETEMIEEEDVLEEAGTGPKDMLSYSWRALRDSSLLLRSQLNASGFEPSQALEAISDIGHLCMEQLKRLRHRGAFSTVAQTFTICCQRTMDIQGPEMLGLRYKWYQEAEVQIDQQAHRLTRRSAGLPAMLASVISPDDHRSFGNFVDAFIAKSQVAILDPTDRLSLPQVHAMNTLREVMINSRFRNTIVPHIQKLLTLATSNLGSNIWAIQNCGLMLYRACILRLARKDDSQSLCFDAGESENTSTSAKLALDLLRSGAYDTAQPPDLTQVDVEGLKEDYDNALVGVEQKFAALDMVAHIHPPNELKDAVCVQLVELLSSPVWLVRERAAEVMASLAPFEELRKSFNECLDALQIGRNQNELHGALLYGRQLLKRWLADASKSKLEFRLDRVVQELFLVMAQNGNRRLAPPVWAAMFEIANDVSKQSLKADIRNTLPSLDHEELSKKVNIRGYYLPETALMYNAALQLIMSDRLGLPTHIIFPILLDRMVSDPNVAKCILERLLSEALVFQPEELLQLCKVISPGTHPDAAPLLIDMVSLSVERNSSEWDAMRAQQILDLLDRPSATREIGASNLVARARLVPLLTRKRGDLSEFNLTVSQDQYLFERDVSCAARDEMDTYVRLRAAKALSAYLPPLQWTGTDSFGLLFTLRDLLNDDDGDVRSLAACTASTFLSRDAASLQLGVFADGTCAPAVSIQLEDHLRSIFCGRVLQPEVLLRKLFDMSPKIDLESYLREFPVDEQVKMIKTESRTLFAVEKQNLYIDEAQEIHFWSSMCRGLTKQSPKLPESVKIALASWISDGLSTISTILRGIDDGHPMLPDVSYDLDTLLLCLRVVSVARVYVVVLMNEVQGHNSDLTRQSIRQRLRILKMLASRRHFNPGLTRTINENLGEVAE